MKRFTAIVLALVLALSLCVVHAGEKVQWCTFSRPEGVEVYSLSDFSRDLAPEGLEGMYDVMTDANTESNVHIFAMPNGRVLLSVACYTDENHGTVQDLYNNWDSVAAGMGQDAVSINRDISCASLETRYGFDALCINTEMVPVSDPSLTLIMEGVVFYDGYDMFESWAVYPVETVTANIPLLQSDLTALRELQGTFSFLGEGGQGGADAGNEELSELVILPTAAPVDEYADFWNNFDSEGEDEPNVSDSHGLIFSNGGDILQATPSPAPENSGVNNIFFFNSDAASNDIPGVEMPAFESAEMVNPWCYYDPDGRFYIWLPEGAVAITPDSTAAEVIAERSRWEEAYPNGGDIFDRFQQQMYEVPYTLLSIPEHGLAWQIAYQDDPVYATITANDFLLLEEDICGQLEERYGRADALDNSHITQLCELNHASMTYAVTCNNRKIMYIVYAGVDADGALREVDLMMLGGDDGKIDPAYAIFLNDILMSLKYLY
ncbi:MAG: hypothetical protein E7331_06465 [Clostridiales bacterium]|nr:hypothetical protein [Clostridiales bacterium]